MLLRYTLSVFSLPTVARVNKSCILPIRTPIITVRIPSAVVYASEY